MRTPTLTLTESMLNTMSPLIRVRHNYSHTSAEIGNSHIPTYNIKISKKMKLRDEKNPFHLFSVILQRNL